MGPRHPSSTCISINYRDEFTVVLTDNSVPQEMIPFEVSSLSEQGKVRAAGIYSLERIETAAQSPEKGTVFSSGMDATSRHWEWGVDDFKIRQHRTCGHDDHAI